ncbi:MAG: tetraacyldisaccharide 4'-kinase [Nitrospirota bacterium]
MRGSYEKHGVHKIMNLSPKLLASLKGEAPMPPWLYLLYPASLIYGFAAGLKAWLYSSGIIKPKRLACKVISVGNITAGGTGKTPMVINIVRMLEEKGIKTAVLTRGYKGMSEGRVRVVSDGLGNILPPGEAGDEPVLIARSLPGVPVVMGSDRYEAGKAAWERFHPRAMVLDDGFQHVRLHRDLNILLMDAAHPFGNGHTIPMGYLREPKRGVKRANFIIFTGATTIRPEEEQKVKSFALSDTSMANAGYFPVSFYNINSREKSREEIPAELFAGKRIFAFCGIANPGSFSLILHKLNAKITGSEEFPDHHSYSLEDVAFLEGKAAESGAEVLVTTEKDAVKLEGLVPAGTGIYALKAGMEIYNGSELLDISLNRALEGQDG